MLINFLDVLTKQTIGLNSGFFLSFTVFLAFNSAEFSNKYLRYEPSDVGVLRLSTYLQFWAIVYLIVTFYLAFFKSERVYRDSVIFDYEGTSNSGANYKVSGSEEGETPKLILGDFHCNSDKNARGYSTAEAASSMDSIEDGTENQDLGAREDPFIIDSDDAEDDNVTVCEVFRKIWKIVNLSNMRILLLVMIIYKIGFMAADSVAALKLIEKGFKKEDLALFALIEFPFQILFAVLAGRWSSGDSPLTSVRTQFPLFY